MGVVWVASGLKVLATRWARRVHWRGKVASPGQAGESKKNLNFGHETRKEVLEGRVSTKALPAWTSSRAIKS
jgi:hypothetical protein